MKRYRNYLSKPVMPTRHTASVPPLRSEIAEHWNKRLAEKIESHTETLQKFAAKLLNEPLRELSWSRGEFEAAAELLVLTELKAVIENKGWDYYGQIRNHWLGQILSKASSIEGSSSVTSNVADRCYLAALAKFYKGDYGTFSADWYFGSPSTPEEAETMRVERQAEMDADFGKAMVEYDKAMARYKEYKKTGVIPEPEVSAQA